MWGRAPPTGGRWDYFLSVWGVILAAGKEGGKNKTQVMFQAGALNTFGGILP